MLVTVTLLADCAARLHAVDTRRVVLKYRQRRAIFRNELSRLVYVREKFDMNALGFEWPWKRLLPSLCQRCREARTDLASAGSIGIWA